MSGFDHNTIRKRFLGLHPAVFAVTIREQPQKVFDLFAGFARWRRYFLHLLGYPRHVMIEPPHANVTVFIFGEEIYNVAQAIREHEDILKPTGMLWNFEIYQMNSQEFRSFTPLN